MREIQEGSPDIYLFALLRLIAGNLRGNVLFRQAEAKLTNSFFARVELILFGTLRLLSGKGLSGILRYLINGGKSTI